MIFSDYMKSLPNTRTETIKLVAKECRVSDVTVYRWINGTVTPEPLKRKVIADALGIPENELFPLEASS